MYSSPPAFVRAVAPRILFVGVMMLVIMPMKAQQLALRKSVDSLQRLLQKQMHDTARVILLCELSRAAQWKDTALAIESAREALNVATQAGFSAGMARAYLAMGFCAITRKDQPMTHGNFSEALRLAKSAGDPKSEAEALLQLAKIPTKENRFDTALAQLRRAIAIAEELNDGHMLGEALKGAAIVCARMGADSSATQYCLQGLELCLRRGDLQSLPAWIGAVTATYDRVERRAQADSIAIQCLHYCEALGDTSSLAEILDFYGKRLYENRMFSESLECYRRMFDVSTGDATDGRKARASEGMGRALVRLGRLAESLSHYNAALAIYEMRENTIRSSALLLSIAAVHEWMGDNVRAVECYQRAIRSLEEIGDSGDDLYRAYHALGSYYQKIGDHDSAEKYFFRIARQAEHLGDRLSLANCYYLLGQSAVARQRFEEALRYIDSSIALLRTNINPRFTSDVTAYRGNILMNMDRPEDAKRSYEEAVALKHSSGDASGEAYTLRLLGRAEIKLGNYDAALPLLKNSARIKHQLGTVLADEWEWDDLAYLNEMKGDTATALLYLDSAFSASKSSDLKTRQRRYLSRIIVLHEARGDFGNAYTRLDEFIALKDTLLREENTKQVNVLKVRFEAERKEKQIVLLEKDMKVRELHLQQRQSELERQRLAAIEQTQHMQLLKRDAEIRSIELQRKRNDLELHSTMIALVHLEEENRKHALDMKGAEIEEQRLLTNIVYITLFLFLAVAGLAMKSMRDKRRTAALAAEAAENRAGAAEARALAQRSEIDRREKEAGKLFTKRLISTQERERKRIAGSLHDGIGQDLLIIKHRAMMALDDEAAAAENLKEILEISEEALDDVRRLSGDLRPVQLERLGLTATLRLMLASVADSARLELNATIEDVDGLVAPAQEIDVYRIVQEGINNIVRHSGASRAFVSLEHSDGTIRLTISDNGRGFDRHLEGVDGPQTGFGLQAMKERVRMLQGHLEITSEAGAGTNIRVSIPVVLVKEVTA